MHQWWWVGEKLLNYSKFSFSAPQTKQLSSESTEITNPTSLQEIFLCSEWSPCTAHKPWRGFYSLWSFCVWVGGRGHHQHVPPYKRGGQAGKAGQKHPENREISLEISFGKLEFHSGAFQQNRKCRSSQISRMLQMMLGKEKEKREVCRPRQRGGNLLWMETKPNQSSAKGCRAERCSHTRG